MSEAQGREKWLSLYESLFGNSLTYTEMDTRTARIQLLSVLSIKELDSTYEEMAKEDAKKGRLYVTQPWHLQQWSKIVQAVRGWKNPYSIIALTETMKIVAEAGFESVSVKGSEIAIHGVGMIFKNSLLDKYENFDRYASSTALSYRNDGVRVFIDKIVVRDIDKMPTVLDKYHVFDKEQQEYIETPISGIVEVILKMESAPFDIIQKQRFFTFIGCDRTAQLVSARAPNIYIALTALYTLLRTSIEKTETYNDMLLNFELLHGKVMDEYRKRFVIEKQADSNADVMPGICVVLALLTSDQKDNLQ